MPETVDPAEFSKRVMAAMEAQRKMLDASDGAATMSGPRAVQPPEMPMRTGATRVYERQETPEERQQRYLEKARQLGPNPATETPEQRTERYRQKAQAAGPAFRNDTKQPPADIELDEDGKVITPQEPLSWSNAGDRIPQAMGEWAADKIGRQSPEQKAQNELRIMQARNKVEMKVQPIRQAVLQVGGPAWKALDYAVSMNDRARNPPPRDIQSFERSDGEDMPIRKYTREDIDKAVAAAKAAAKEGK